MSAAPRIFVDADLADEGAVTPVTADQAHYLRTVLRLGEGERVRVFNGRDGEWDAVILTQGKRGASLQLAQQRRTQTPGPDIHLIFAPLKKTRTDFLVEKATELGVRALRPVFTVRTDAARVNVARLTALAREAAEQTERLDIPSLAEPVKLTALLDAWARNDPGRRLIFADEGAPRDTGWAAPTGGAPALVSVLQNGPRSVGDAVLIGPEGGFTTEERSRLRAARFAQPVHLGPRILRAETAATAALAVWQACAGDWTDATQTPPAS